MRELTDKEKLLHTLRLYTPTTTFQKICFLNNGIMLAVAARRYSKAPNEPTRLIDFISIYNICTGKLLRSFSIPNHKDHQIISNLISLPNNHLAFTKSQTTKIEILNCLTGKLIPEKEIILSPDYFVEDMQVLPNGNIFTIQRPSEKNKASTSYRIYNPVSGKLVKTFPQTKEHTHAFVFPSGDVALTSFISGFKFISANIEFMNTKNGKIFYEQEEKPFDTLENKNWAEFYAKAIKSYEENNLQIHKDSTTANTNKSGKCCSMF